LRYTEFELDDHVIDLLLA